LKEEGLFLPEGYHENPPATADADGAGYWADPEETRARNRRRYQDPVYRLAARWVRRHRSRLVLDVGCGTGVNLVNRVGKVTDRTVGVDQASAIAMAREQFPDRQWISGDLRAEELWADLRELGPDLLICADVIEHVTDPRELLARLHGLLGSSGALILSTPDRDRIEGAVPFGPPRNPRHVREWSFPEMQRLLDSTGFRITSARHVLPRRYPLTTTDAHILAWRALHLKVLPEPRSCMVFELSKA
jgi:2-polyprenyl-3-methyl-5-hydroxy-6-metoxy-1,4-benzoquinol methylase